MSEIQTPNAAKALEDAGFMPLPRMWVKREDMHKVYSIINSVGLQVREIRQTARVEYETAHPPKVQTNPITDKEAAWAAYEQTQGSQ